MATVHSNFADLTRRLDSALTAELIATPTPLTRAEGSFAVDVARQMAETGFDILPADDAITEYWVRPDLLSFEGDDPIKRQLTAADLIATGTPIASLLRLMAENQRGFYFLLAGAHVSGLITFADLNKRPVRAALFTVITELEEMLIDAFENAHRDEHEWRHWLSGKSYRSLLGFWQDARDRGVELSKVRYASLSQLIRLLERSDSLGPQLSATLGDDWPTTLLNIALPVRNDISHSGRYLVNRPGDVPRLHEAYAFVERALNDLTHLWQSKEGE
jgi:hypothetical protein